MFRLVLNHGGHFQGVFSFSGLEKMLQTLSVLKCWWEISSQNFRWFETVLFFKGYITPFYF